MPASPFKRFLRRFGVEIKRTAYGLDPWLDLAALLAPAKEPTILDIGANLGQTTRQLAEISPGARIWAFEPNGEIFPKLMQNVAGLPRVTPVNAALGSAEATASLKVTGATVNSSLLDYDRPTGIDSVKKELSVSVKTIDDFAEKENIARIDLLKTDTQGYDLHVLNGAARMFQERRIQAVFAEVMFTRFYREQAEFHEIYSLLYGHGLRLSGFYNVARETGFDIDWADALFVLP
ncbi:MAG TPA: FkbM family methyltransferase [Chthoniobacteraceae bacterium]|jgi:FkbM family methyltransferase